MKTTRSPREGTVIFLHVHKAAGTTLNRIIDRQYQPRDIYSIDRDGHDFDHFINLDEVCRAQIRMLRGHMNFGLHELLPGPSTYFVLLREPVERVISYYYFIRCTPKHHHYELIRRENLSLKAFLENEVDHLMSNAQTKMLAGGPGDLESAKRNLAEYFTVVGLMERFDETLLLLQMAFGWQNIFYVQQNVATKRVKRRDLSLATLDTLVKANQLDIELYRYATMLFEAQVRQQGPSFAKEVKAFQSANQILGPLVNITEEFRKWSIRSFVQKWIRRMLHQSK